MPKRFPIAAGTYRVLKRVTKIINEKTGKMQEMKTPCIILDSVIASPAIANAACSAPGASTPIGGRSGWNASNRNRPALIRVEAGAAQCEPASSNR